MNPFGTRARAQELALLLDGALDVPSAASTAAAASTASAASAREAPHAALALRLRTAGTAPAPAAAPRAEFRDALRTRLVAVAAVQAAAQAAVQAAVQPDEAPRATAVTGRRRQRGLAVAAGAMASVVVVTGVAVAGSRSLPGDPFYGVKRGTEALELATAGSALDRGSRHLEFAAARLREVRGLTVGGDRALRLSGTGPLAAGSGEVALGGSLDQRVRDTLAAMDTETRLGNDLLTRAARDLHRDTGLRILARFANRQAVDLQALLPDLPRTARPRAQASLTLVGTVGAQARQLLTAASCVTGCGPTASPHPAGTGAPRPSATPAAARSSAPASTPTNRTTPVPAGSLAASPDSASPGEQPPRSPLPLPSLGSSLPLPVPVPGRQVPLPSTVPLPLPLPLPTLGSGLLDPLPSPWTLPPVPDPPTLPSGS
jgi:hypothetical protein